MRNDLLPIDTGTRVPLGELTLDLVRNRLEDTDGQPIALRPQAFAVLRHLALNPGRLVTKEALFTTVWSGVVVTDDSLVQAIGDIRRALGTAGQECVRTVPRRGYMLVPYSSSEAAPGTRPAKTQTEEHPSAPIVHDTRAADPVAPQVAYAIGDPAAGHATAKNTANSSRRTLLFGGAAVALASVAAALAWLRWNAPPEGALPQGAAPRSLLVAVLPFESGSADGSGGWIADSLGVGISSALARIAALPVLWVHGVRDPARPLKSEVAAAIERKATHLLHGSVELARRRVRATVQLLRAPSGEVMWSERYERPLDELFTLQDDISAGTVLALQVRLTEGEQARSRTHPKGDLKAWELATRGYVRFQTGGPDALAQARRLFEQALVLDPDYAWARTFLAATCFLEARFAFSPDPARWMQRALDEATRAVNSDPELPDAHSTRGAILLALRRYDEAVAEGRRAIALGPSHAELHAVLAQTMLAIGQWADAVALIGRALELTLRPPSWNYVPLAIGLTFLGQHDRAMAAADVMDRLAESAFQHHAALCVKAFALVEAGRASQARDLAPQIEALLPGRGPSAFGNGLLFRDAKDAQRIERALRAAGVAG